MTDRLELPARAAYGAFTTITSRDTDLPAPPPWEKLRPGDREGWRAIADAVLMVNGLHAATLPQPGDLQASGIEAHHCLGDICPVCFP